MSVFDFLSNNIWVVYSSLVIIVIILIVYLGAFLQGREISFWPPKIGVRPHAQFKNPGVPETPELLHFNGYGVAKVGYFSEFSNTFNKLIPEAEEMTLFFVHSRRWRENNSDLIEKFLEKRNNKLTVILPNIENKRLVASIKEHFDDGVNMEAFIKDAYRYFADVLKRRPQGIDIRFSNLYPTYSVYKINSSMIVAMYPASSRKKDVPTFQFVKGGRYWDFVEDDLQWMLTNSTPITLEKLEDLVNRKER